jgi:type 1 glutamine amidotransferase
MKRTFLQNCFLFFAMCMLTTSATQLFAGDGKLKGSRVLVYTKNGKGYVHDNIASAVACIQELGKTNGFTVDVADTSLVFTEENLKKYSMLIFTSTNNDVFANDDQRVAFRRYIEAGGGFVGVHSVTGTERNWRWFKQMLGETFTWHAKNQKFTVKKMDGVHASMEGVPALWEVKDECYFGKELYPGIKVLMAHVVSSLDMHEKSQDSLLQKNLGSYKDYYPAVWYQPFQGGNVWVTTLGHDKEMYKDPVYVNHLLQGIKYMATQYRGLNYANAHAVGKDDPLSSN